jgi:methyl-accepting chemotaxis protein/methyl-accepting chemotaxis protein-1 (serine sensor receptor)
MRSTLTLGTKLLAGAISMFALMALLGYFGLSTIGTFKDQFDTTVEREGRKTDLIHTILLAQSDMVSAQTGIVMASLAKDPVEADSHKQEFQEQSHVMRSAIQELLPLLQREETRSLATDIASSLSAWQPQFEEIVRQCSAGNLTEASRIRKDLTVPIYQRIASSSRQLTTLHAEFVEQTKKTLAGQQDRSRWIAIALLCLGLLVGGMVVVTVRNVSRGLQHAVAGLAEGTAHVATAAAQVSSGGQSLAQGASQQAASLEETSASAEEINSMTHKNAENSQAAAQFMAEASHFIAEANRNVEEMVVSMREINASSDKISKIIKVIDEIAFQTNILALNAAVEAARAGEAGMGFAVVADEVRNLSQRCAQAAKDTAALIEESIVKSNEGKLKLDKVAEVIGSVTESSGKVKTLVDEVSLGSQEQARGIDQISKAIAQMERVTQKTAANAEESASAGEELGAQSKSMNGIVEKLAQLVGGATLASSDGDALRTKPLLPGKGDPASTPAPSRPKAAYKNGTNGTSGANGSSAGSAAHPATDHKHTLPLDGDFSDF